MIETCENLINTAQGLAMCLKLGKGNALFTSETNSYVVVEIVLFFLLYRDFCCMADDLIGGFFFFNKKGKVEYRCG